MWTRRRQLLEKCQGPLTLLSFPSLSFCPILNNEWEPTSPPHLLPTPLLCSPPSAFHIHSVTELNIFIKASAGMASDQRRSELWSSDSDVTHMIPLSLYFNTPVDDWVVTAMCVCAGPPFLECVGKTMRPVSPSKQLWVRVSCTTYTRTNTHVRAHTPSVNPSTWQAK